ncbi:MAG: radical SAM protein [Theionarchaea archaeon]|nr:radical SAM protein [Theionarchaea archaeon]
MARIEVDSPCNNRCIHCLTGRREQKDVIGCEEQIKRAHNEKKDGIVILGGEPTLRGDILDIVSCAREIGFKRINLITNARTLSNREFAGNLIRVGISDFVVKLWGARREVHDKITGAKGSFEQTVSGIKNIVSLKGEGVIMGYSGILMENYVSLAELIQLFADLRVRWVRLRLPPVEDALIPLTQETMKYIYSAIETANRLNVGLEIENIPFCFMRGYEDYVYISTTRKDRLEDCDFLDFVKVEQHDGKTKVPECNQCKYSFLCGGVWNKYLEKDSVCEVNPVENMGESRMLQRIDDLIGKEGLFHPLVESGEVPEGLRADAIVHFSGGIDSTVAAGIYASRNKERKVVLVTYCHQGLLNVNSSRVNGSYLMEKYPNIVAHLHISLLQELYVPLCFGRDYKEHAMRLSGNYGCIACKLLMYAYSVFLQTAYFKGDTIISGNNLTIIPDRGGHPIPQMPEVVTLIKDFVGEYGMACVNPVYAVSSKQRIVLLAETMGLPATSMFQSKCILGVPILCKDMEPVVQFLRERILPILRNVLTANMKRL